MPLDSAFIWKEPLGPGLIIAPWNYPRTYPWCPWWAPSQQVIESLLLTAPCQSPQPRGLTAAHRDRKEGHQVAKKAWSSPFQGQSPLCSLLTDLLTLCLNISDDRELTPKVGQLWWLEKTPSHQIYK